MWRFFLASCSRSCSVDWSRDACEITVDESTWWCSDYDHMMVWLWLWWWFDFMLATEAQHWLFSLFWLQKQRLQFQSVSLRRIHSLICSVQLLKACVEPSGEVFTWIPVFKGRLNNKSYLNRIVNSSNMTLFAPHAPAYKIPFSVCLSSEEFPFPTAWYSLSSTLLFD